MSNETSFYIITIILCQGLNSATTQKRKGWTSKACCGSRVSTKSIVIICEQLILNIKIQPRALMTGLLP